MLFRSVSERRCAIARIGRAMARVADPERARRPARLGVAGAQKPRLVSPGHRPIVPSDAPRTVGDAMPLCFIDPQDAIRVIAESVGRESKRKDGVEIKTPVV